MPQVDQLEFTKMRLEDDGGVSIPVPGEKPPRLLRLREPTAGECARILDLALAADDATNAVDGREREQLLANPELSPYGKALVEIVGMLCDEEPPEVANLPGWALGWQWLAMLRTHVTSPLPGDQTKALAALLAVANTNGSQNADATPNRAARRARRA